MAVDMQNTSSRVSENHQLKSFLGQKNYYEDRFNASMIRGLKKDFFRNTSPEKRSYLIPAQRQPYSKVQYSKHLQPLQRNNSNTSTQSSNSNNSNQSYSSGEFGIQLNHEASYYRLDIPTLNIKSGNSNNSALPSLFDQKKKLKVEPIKCTICGNQVYGEDNYQAHMDNHQNTLNQYQKEKASMYRRNGSYTTLLDDKTKISNPHKLKLVSNSRANLDLLLLDEMTQSDLLNFDNVMKKFEQRDWNEGFEGLKKLESNNDCLAIQQLGKLYENGICTLIDQKKAYRYYKKALKEDKNGIITRDSRIIDIVLDFLDGKFNYQITNISTSSFNESMDKSKFSLLESSLFQSLKAISNEKPNGEAYYWIGRFYEECIGMDSSNQYLKLAESWYRKASTLGNPNAMYQLADLYLKEMNDEQSFKEAVQLLKNAIVHSFPMAAYKLSLLTKNGIGVAPNSQEAKSLMEFATSSGVLTKKLIGMEQYRDEYENFYGNIIN